MSPVLKPLCAGFATQPFGIEQTHAVELMVFSLGLRTQPYDNYFGVQRHHIPAEGVAVNWATSSKVSNDWALTSRLGADYAHTRTSNNYGGDSVQDSANVLAGVGASYALRPNLKLTTDLNYMPFKISRDNRVDNTLLTVGNAFQF